MGTHTEYGGNRKAASSRLFEVLENCAVPKLAALSVDQIMAVLSLLACADATTSNQPKPTAKQKTDESASSNRR